MRKIYFKPLAILLLILISCSNGQTTYLDSDSIISEEEIVVVDTTDGFEEYIREDFENPAYGWVDEDEEEEYPAQEESTTWEMTCHICGGMRSCQLCHGLGSCGACGGGGWLYQFSEVVSCGNCGGSGRCPSCEGSGACFACEGRGVQEFSY